MLRTKPNPCCFLCGVEGRLVHTNVPDLFYHVPGNWNLRQCVNRACSLLWLDPMPVAEDLGQAYSNYWTHSEKAPQGLSQYLLKGAYQAATFIPDVLLGLRREQARLTAMYLEAAPPGRLLDVGCGRGDFLNLMRNRRWKVCGSDFDPQAVENARRIHNLEVYHGDLAQHRFPDGMFDAITMSHVIEHVPDPIALLAEARRILKPGGTLVVTSPNSQSLGYLKFQTYWFGLDPPRHVRLFSPSSLAECARRAGCDPVTALSTAGRAETFIAGSFKLRGAALKVPSDNSLLWRTLKTLLLRYREQLSLRANPTCGEEAVMVFHKQPAAPTGSADAS